MSDEAKPAMVPLNIVYMGKRLHQDGSLMDYFITLEKLRVLVDASAPMGTLDYAASPFSSKSKHTPSTIGAIYVIDGRLNDEGIVQSLLLGNNKASGHLASDTETSFGGVYSQWAVMDRVARADKQAELELERLGKKTDDLTAAMDRIRWAFQNTPRNRRNAFRLMILNHLDT